jgi:hypothetical protein
MRRPPQAVTTSYTGASVAQILKDLARHPVQLLLKRWNWKSAILSSTARSAVFFCVNLSAGSEAARAAFVTELIFRATTAGFYGALTQAFRCAHPPWTGTAAAMLLLPLTTHLLELLVHWLRGTAHLAASVVASIAFTSISTAFNLFAMRRGALIVGADSESIWSDLRSTPWLLLAFCRDGCGALGRLAALTINAAREVSAHRRARSRYPSPGPS